MQPSTQDVRGMAGPVDASAWRWFAVWAATGALGGFGIIGLMSIGLPLLVVAALVSACLLTLRADSRVGAWGLVSGASVAAWFLAWTNRGGPGEVCHTTGNTTSCQQAWSPVPFALVAVLLLGGGVAAFVLARQRDRERPRA